MCGIAVIVCGVRIELSSLSSPSKPPFERLQFTVEDLKSVLSQRGPDSVGEKKILLQPNVPTCAQEPVTLSISEAGEGTHNLENATSSGELHFIGSTLQLRGTNPIIQPLVDSSGNILAYNGEVFGGIELSSYDNDTEVLLRSLEKPNALVPDVLSMIKGPWAIIYWQESSRTLWFGKDAFGRRSLLVHWPTVEDPLFLLSSASPASSVANGSGLDSENGDTIHRFWEELPCGVYSMSFGVSESGLCVRGEVTKREWRNNMWKELIEWERGLVVPRPEDLSMSSLSGIQEEKDNALSTFSGLAQTVLVVLKESVRRRTSLHSIFQGEREVVPVAVLFSGGLDSMILAALLDQCLDNKCNQSFDGPNAPDRISAKAGIKELRKIAPMRRWKLVEIDADLSKLTLETKRVMSLINPADTYMDLNIGTALWLAARGDGWIHEESDNYEDSQRIRYKSVARILLVGAGADEQCAGYGRHRTKYRNGSWTALDQEMKLDMQRIWKRNLGRDDRCIADNGKEARFPFLDEDVIKTLLDIPLWEIADLEQPSGKGDKKILRQVAKLLGLHEVAKMPKRAIQFGSRIARESNRKNFGSNRAANQASAVSYACDIIIIFVEEPWVKIGKPLLLASQFLVQFIKLLCLYSSLQLSRGLLLYGPSGTGKTSLVRAVVQECNAHLIVLSPYSVHRVHAGENEKVLREAFAEASSVSDNKPSVIFIDEIDVLCPRGRGEQNSRIASQLFTLMDSNKPSSSAPRVVVVTSTNRVDAIDPALRKAGRFLYTKKVNLGPSVDLQAMATSCNVMSITRGITVEIPKVTWDDVGGLKDLKCVEDSSMFRTGTLISGKSLRKRSSLLEQSWRVCRESGTVSRREDIAATAVFNRHFLAANKSLKPALTVEEVEAYSSFRKLKRWDSKPVPPVERRKSVTLYKMGRGNSCGGGQSSLNYLFGGGDAPPPPKPVPAPTAEPTNRTAAPAPVPVTATATTTVEPAIINKEIPAGIKTPVNNYARAEGQNTGNFLTDRPSTKVHAAPGGGSSLDYLFTGGK
ncbi:hypothetical protein Bca101_013541 [Brassica carinata]